MATTPGGIFRYVRLLLDPKAREALEKEMQDALDEGTKPEKAKRNLSATERAVESLTDRARKLALALAAAFGITNLLRFGKESMAAALDARGAWTRLDTAVRGTGRTMDQVRPQVDSLVDSMEKLGVEDEAVASSLALALEITDDYERSLRVTAVAVDLAAQKGFDLETATMLSARAAIGATETLGRYGIEVKKGEDGLVALERATRNAAAAQDAGVIAQKRIVNAWGNFKEAVGEALLTAGGGTSVMDTLRATIVALTKVVEDHPEGLRFMGETMIWLGRVAGTILISAFSGVAAGGSVLLRVYEALAKAQAATTSGETSARWTREAEAVRALADEAKAAADSLDKVARALWSGEAAQAAPTRGNRPPPLGREGDTGAGDEERKRKAEERLQVALRAVRIRGLEGEATEELIAIERELLKVVDDETRSLQDRTDAEERLIAIKAALESGQSRRLEQAERMIAAGSRQAQGLDLLRELEEELREQIHSTMITEEERLALEDRLAQVRSALADLDPAEMFGTSIRNFLDYGIEGADGFVGALRQIKKEAHLVSAAVMLLAKGQGKAVLQELAIMAKGKAIENVARSVEEFAKGLAASTNPLRAPEAAGHFAAAKAHLTAAAQWGLAGGIVGAISGGGGGGGSAREEVSGSGSARGSAIASDTRPAMPNVRVVVDMFDKTKGSHVRAFREMQNEIREVYGSELEVEYRTGAGGAYG